MIFYRFVDDLSDSGCKVQFPKKLNFLFVFTSGDLFPRSLRDDVFKVKFPKKLNFRVNRAPVPGPRPAPPKGINRAAALEAASPTESRFDKSNRRFMLPFREALGESPDPPASDPSAIRQVGGSGVGVLFRAQPRAQSCCSSSEGSILACNPQYNNI